MTLFLMFCCKSAHILLILILNIHIFKLKQKPKQNPLKNQKTSDPIFLASFPPLFTNVNDILSITGDTLLTIPLLLDNVSI